MGTVKEKVHLVEKLIKAIYDQRPVHQASTDWSNNVMRHIRRLDVWDSRLAELINFEKLVWRLSAAAALTAAVLTIYFIKTDVTAPNELLTVLVDYPAEIARSMSFGL